MLLTHGRIWSAYLKEVFLKGDYVFKTENPTPLIIDAGGNIGITTLFFKNRFPNSRVIAFEAARRNYELLVRNVDDNNLKDVQVVFGALGTETGTRTLFFNTRNPGGSTMHADVANSKREKAFTAEEVPALRLSDYITEPVDLLKLDVEGGEGEILEDLEERGVLGHIKEIVMEYHANESNPANALVALLERLERGHFKVIIYDNEHGAYGKRAIALPHYHFMIRAFRSTDPI